MDDLIAALKARLQKSVFAPPDGPEEKAPE